MRGKKPLNILLGAVFISLLISCGVNNETAPKTSQPDLFGKWQWVKTTGGIMGGTWTPENTNAQQVLILSLNGTFKWFANGVIWAHGTFTFKSIVGHDSIAFHPQENLTISSKMYSINDQGELNMLDYCDDCYNYTFVKFP